MKAIMAGVGLLALAGCASPVATVPPTSQAPSGVTPATVCAAVNGVATNPTAVAQLASAGASSQIGTIWSYLQTGCNGPVPVAGVDASWTAELWASFKAALPSLLPQLLALGVGLL